MRGISLLIAAYVCDFRNQESRKATGHYKYNCFARSFVGAIVAEREARSFARTDLPLVVAAAASELAKNTWSSETDGHPSRHQTCRRDSLFTRYRNFIPSPSIVAAAPPPYEPSPRLLARIRYACSPRVGFSSTF